MGTLKKPQQKNDCLGANSTQSKPVSQRKKIVVNLRLRTEEELRANRSSAYAYII